MESVSLIGYTKLKCLDNKHVKLLYIFLLEYSHSMHQCEYINFPEIRFQLKLIQLRISLLT